MKLIKGISSLFFGVLLCASCMSEDTKPVLVTKPVIEKIMSPFRYHKAVEIKPGLTLDVLGWGRGSKSVGGYLILRSDSTHLNYRSISGELDGRIVDAWDMDLDSDGNPELYIHSKGEGEGSYLNMYIYEYSSNGSNQQIRFPGLSGSLKKGYRGLDSIYIKEGKLMREFPVFSSEDTIAKSSGEIRRMEYNLRGNSFQVKEVEEKN